MKRITIPMAILFLLVFSISSSVAVFAEEETNVALGKPVTSSGYYVNAPQDESEGLVNDGDLDTKWCARPENYIDETYDFEDMGHWIIIDLEQETLVSKFELYQASTGGLDLGKYEYNMLQMLVEVSVDGEAWTTLIEEEDMYDYTEDWEVYTKEFDPISVRYFRVSSYEPSANGDLTMRLPEIMIYAAAADATANPLPTLTPTPEPTPTPESTPTPEQTVTPKATATKAPTATVSTTPSSTDTGEGGLPAGVIFALVAGIVILAGGVVAFVMAKKKKKE